MPVQRELFHKANQLQGDEGSQDWGVPCYLVSITCCDQHKRCRQQGPHNGDGACLQHSLQASPQQKVWICQSDGLARPLIVQQLCLCGCSAAAERQPPAITATYQSLHPLLLVPCSTLQKDIEKCDPSLSEGMQLSVQGDILRYAQLAFEGKPAAPTQDLACKTAPEGPLSSKDDFSNTADPSAASALYSRGGSTYFTGSGDIYTGIFRATQNYQAAADEFGRLQLVYVRQVDSTGLSQPPKGYYVAKPYSLSLQAYKYKPYDEEMYTGPVRN